MRLNGTREAIEDADYPLTTEEFVAAHGDHEIDLVDGSETVEDVLGRLGEETFETPEDARLSVYACVSAEGVGRQGYSDRDPTTNGSTDPHDEVSF